MAADAKKLYDRFNKSKERKSTIKSKMADNFVTKRPTMSENMLLSPLSYSGGGGDELIEYTQK